MERQEGYYWVKHQGEFKIAKYWIAEESWTMTYDTSEYLDNDFEFINENRIKAPGELPD